MIERDITGKQSEATTQIAAIGASSDDAAIGVMLDGEIASWNRGAERMYGYTAEEAVGRQVSFLGLVPPGRDNAVPAILARVRSGERVDHFETVHRRRDGTVIDVSLTISPVVDASGRVAGASEVARAVTERERADAKFYGQLGSAPDAFLAQIRDITERRRSEERLVYPADHDPLTGLLNRRSFERELEAHWVRTECYGGGGAAIVLDLDHFKFINDTLGHHAGDEAITRAARVLVSRLRRTDVLARLGEDEFAVLLPTADSRSARLVTEELLGALRAETVELGPDHARPLAASAGIALLESGGDPSGEDVLVNADLAMHDAKNAGRDRARLYATGKQEGPSMKRRVTWAQRIGTALQRDGLLVLAQPIVDFATGRVSQYELLLRMRDERGDHLPGSFLYIAERLGMAQEIDRWVTKHAIALLAERRARGEVLVLEVNLSGLSIGDPELLALVSRELEGSNVSAHSLIFDVTETAAVINIARAGQFIRDLTGLGCRVALDDFGAGYGSFYYLKHLPFDFLKIDGEFIKGCRTSETDRLLIKAAVDIATGMGKRTIAECVGDAETVDLLTNLGVDYGQGFHLGRPGPFTGTPPTAAYAGPNDQ